MTKTTEIKIFSSPKSQLLVYLSEHGLQNYVDASYDGLNHCESQADELIATLLDDDTTETELPVTFYPTSSEELSHIIKVLQQFKGVCRWEVSSYDSILWQQAWEDREEDFNCGPFQVLVSGKRPAKLTDRQVFIDAAGAFGSGQHATTKAILDLMIREYKASDTSLLDVGTGTGILAIIAEKLGIQRVVATDIDEKAISAAHLNRLGNQCQFAIIKGTFPETIDRYDLIVSNILPPVVNQLLSEFKQRLSLQGRIIITGFNQSNKDLILADIRSVGLQVRDEWELRGWLALTISF